MENQLLASLLLNPRLADITWSMPAEVFAESQNKKIYSQIREAHVQGRPLRWPGKMGEIRVPTTITDLLNQGDLEASQDQVEQLAEGLQEQHRRRQLHQLGKRIQSAAQCVASAEILRDITLETAQIASSNFNAAQDFSGAQIAERIRERQAARASNPTLIRGVRTGFDHLDAHVGGLGEGRVSVWSGPTGAGKSTLILNALANASLGIDGRDPSEIVPGLYITQELPPEEAEDRLHGMITGSTLQMIVRGDVDGNQAAEVLERGQLVISSDEPRTISDVIALLRKHSVLSGLKFAVVDYLGNLMPEKADRGLKEYQQLGRWARLLEATAKELHMHIAIVSQLNRQAEGEEGPSRQHVAGSYQLAYTAGYFLILNRQDQLCLEKCRYAAYPVDFELCFDRATQRINDLGVH